MFEQFKMSMRSNVEHVILWSLVCISSHIFQKTELFSDSFLNYIKFDESFMMENKILYIFLSNKII